MRGPRLTTTELVAYLAARIERFERLGLAREAAVHAVALDDGLDENKVAELVGQFEPASALRVVAPA